MLKHCLKWHEALYFTLTVNLITEKPTARGDRDSHVTVPFKSTGTGFASILVKMMTPLSYLLPF